MDDPDPGLALSSGMSGRMPRGIIAPEHPNLTVDILINNPDWRRLGAVEAEVRRLVHAVFTKLRYDISQPLEIGIVLSSDAQAHRLNQVYRGKDMPTNVLSFPISDPGEEEQTQSCLLGEVILALETILQEAHQAGVSPNDHLSHLVVHGILHLIGYDHRTDAEATRMETEESDILLSLGIRDPHAAAVKGNTL